MAMNRRRIANLLLVGAGRFLGSRLGAIFPGAVDPAHSRLHYRDRRLRKVTDSSAVATSGRHDRPGDEGICSQAL